MKTMTLTEFNQNSSRAIAHVRNGETVQVTSRGTPVAEVRPPRESDDPIEAMIAAGIIERTTATGRLDLSQINRERTPLPPEFANIDELLEWSKGEY